MKSFKHLFIRALGAAPGRLHFAAHSHHLWPDASFEGHMRAWEDAARLADRKWEEAIGPVAARAQNEVARELGLPNPDTIVFSSNTHEHIVKLFSAKRARGAIDVLTSDGEFHSFRRQAARWAEDGHVRLHVVACAPAESFAERFVAAARAAAPDIAFVSHVMFRNGQRFDGWEELASLAAADGMWVVIDSYHSFMALPCDFGAAAARMFVLGGGYKYAMAGEGAAFMHCPPGFGARPSITGWYADFDAIAAPQGGVAYSAGGSRFAGATYDPSGLYRFVAVREMLAREGLGTAAISARVAALRKVLADTIARGAAGRLCEAEVLTPNADGPQPRFLALRHAEAGAWKKALAGADVIVDVRDDILRIGLGLYHDEADIPTFCARARQALAAQA